MAEHGVSEIFDPSAWREVPGFEDLEDLTYHRAVEHGTVRIAFDRPEVRNAFRPGTVDELLRVLEHARASSDVGCVILTGNGPAPKDGGWAVCSGGDRRVPGARARPVRPGGQPRAGAPAPPRTAAHPRVPAADPVHAQGGAVRGPRLGGRR